MALKGRESWRWETAEIWDAGGPELLEGLGSRRKRACPWATADHVPKSLAILAVRSCGLQVSEAGVAVLVTESQGERYVIAEPVCRGDQSVSSGTSLMTG